MPSYLLLLLNAQLASNGNQCQANKMVIFLRRQKPDTEKQVNTLVSFLIYKGNQFFHTGIDTYSGDEFAYLAFETSVNMTLQPSENGLVHRCRIPQNIAFKKGIHFTVKELWE